MGADMLMTWARAPEVSVEELHRRVDLLPDELLYTLGDVFEYLSDSPPAEPAEVRTWIHTAVDDVTSGRRDVTTLYVECAHCSRENRFIVTGGESWGDPPTDVYDSVSLVGEAGVTEPWFPWGEG